MPLPGEASAKVGNRYELYWTVFCLLDVVEGRYDSIHLVPPGDEGQGIEFYLRKDKLTSHHQAKRQNGKSGKWTIAELDNVGVLSALQKKLSVPQNSFVFVSMDSAGELRELVYRAKRSKDWGNFQSNFISAKSQSKTFSDLCSRLKSTSQDEIPPVCWSES